MARAFRFGVIAERMGDRRAWTELARRTEALGYSTLLLRDHLVPDFFGHQFAPLIALMAAADATATLRVGTMVLDNDFRHPALLAKEIATLDVLSGGRVELGLGAGWLEREYAVAGLPYDRAGVRIDRLEEAISVLKRLWAGTSVTHAGDQYRVEGLACWPPPMQRPRPPLLVGGGSRRVLTLAGREADIAGILTTSVASGVVVDQPLLRRAEHVAEKIGWVQAGAGERFPELELSMIPSVVVTDDRPRAIGQLIAERGWSGVTPADVADMPSTLVGSPTEIAEQLQRWRSELGISYIVVGDDMLEAIAPVVAELAGR